MVRGRAGSGKTIRGLQFLDAGMANGETGLFIEMDAIVRLTRLKTRVCARTMYHTQSVHYYFYLVVLV